MEAPGHISNSSGSMEAPRTSGRIALVGNSSSVGMEATVTRSSAHIIRNSNASITRDQGALVGLATPGVGGIRRSRFRFQERPWRKCMSATGVEPPGMSPGFAEHRMLLRGHAVRVEPPATPLGKKTCCIIHP